MIEIFAMFAILGGCAVVGLLFCIIVIIIFDYV